MARRKGKTDSVMFINRILSVADTMTTSQKLANDSWEKTTKLDSQEKEDEEEEGRKKSCCKSSEYPKSLRPRKIASNRLTLSPIRASRSKGQECSKG
jgi:hypothetical protein